MDDTTIAGEIINLSEQNHIHLYQAIKEIWALAGQTGEDGNNLEFAVAMESFLQRLRKENIIRYTLLMTQIGDQPNDRPFARWDMQEAAMFIANNFSQAMAADITVGRVLSVLSDGLPIDLDEEHEMLRQSSAYVTFKFGNPLTAEYQFRSEEQYFIFLLQHFVLSKPNVAVCQFCGRFFIPKTRKKTLYCDRIVRDARSCKRVAPHLKRKEKIAASGVLSEFKRVKEMMEKRYNRTGDDKTPSIIDITYEQYFEWLLLATDARDRYLAGELTEDEAISIIYVPKKDEMLEDNLAEYTLANSGTQS